MEVYRDVKGYEGLYQVSNLGNVKSLNYNRGGKERILKPSYSVGYLKVSLCLNKAVKNRKIHQLVAEAFLNHKSCGHNLVVNHINFNKTDNRVDNLEIVTARENCNHKHIKSSSKYTGVTWYKSSKKWMSQITINGKNKHLGYFDSELKASNAYELALNKIKNELCLV